MKKGLLFFLALLMLFSSSYAESHEHTPQYLPARPAACGQNGFTAGSRCLTCGETLSGLETTPALSHWFDAWLPAEEGCHTATCKREKCRQSVTLPCARYDFIFEGTSHHLCPVCGVTCNQELFDPIPDAAVTVPWQHPSQRGEVTFFGCLAPFTADVLYAFTMVWEYGGGVAADWQPVTVTLPLRFNTRHDFKLVHKVDFLPSGDCYRTGIEIPYTMKDNKITFTTDQYGLFLLVRVDEKDRSE